MSDQFVLPGEPRVPVAPAAGPAKGVPITDPRHWHFHRRAETDAELAEMAAASWMPNPESERILATQRYPDVYERIPFDLRQGAEQYGRTRAAAAAAGLVDVELPQHVLLAVDALVESLRATNVDDAVPAAKAAFTDAVLHGDWPAIRTAWFAWLEAHADVDRRRAEKTSIEGQLFLGAVGYIGTIRPVFLEELERALGGRPFRG